METLRKDKKSYNTVPYRVKSFILNLIVIFIINLEEICKSEINNNKMAFDVYVSYAEEDSEWLTTLVDEIEDNNLSVCLRSRNFDNELSLIENRKILVEQCSSCVLVFSKHYCKKASEWSYFTKFIKSKDDKSISGFLDNKGILCVYLTECNVPELFGKQKMLDWTADDLRDIFWQRLIKFLKAAKKKSDIKKALSPDVRINTTSSTAGKKLDKTVSSDNFAIHNESFIKSGKESPVDNKETETKVNDDDDDLANTKEEEEEDEDLVNGGDEKEKLNDYILFDNIYPHLVSSSFCAEDEDLTKEEVETLTLKMEDVNTIMLLNENNNNNEKLSKNSQNSNYEENDTKKCFLDIFESQHEQMELLDALQTVNEKFQSRFDALSTQSSTCGTTNPNLDLRKKRYRRLLKNFQDCLMKAVNGKKDTQLINSLPFVAQMLDDCKDIHGFKCHCCDGLYHSVRALDMHIGFCIKQQWKELMQFVPKKHY